MCFVFHCRMSFSTNFSSLTNGVARNGTFSIKAPKFNKDETTVIQCDQSFEPTKIYKLWSSRDNDIAENIQEDAEEFLSFVLNKINDEMLEVRALISFDYSAYNRRNPLYTIPVLYYIPLHPSYISLAFLYPFSLP